MLGWQITVTRPASPVRQADDRRIAPNRTEFTDSIDLPADLRGEVLSHWFAHLEGLYWADTPPTRELRGDGYPCIFAARAGDILERVEPQHMRLESIDVDLSTLADVPPRE